MEGFKAKGSFGIPEGAKKQLEEQREKASPVAAAEVPQELVEDKEAPKEDSAEAKRTEQLKRMRDIYEESLGVKITEDDVRDYIFKGRLIKEVQIIPGYMNGVLQTLNAQESGVIDEHMAAFRDKGKFTTDGLANEHALTVLAYTWKSAQKIGKEGKLEAYRSLGDTIEDRNKSVRAMGAHVLDAATDANTGFNFLLKYALGEKKLVKKS